MGTFQLLPPSPDVCHQCAVKHDPTQPHDATSLFYGVYFQMTFGRSPTWHDAMKHCTLEMKQAWIQALKAQGINVPPEEETNDISIRERQEQQ